MHLKGVNHTLLIYRAKAVSAKPRETAVIARNPWQRYISGEQTLATDRSSSACDSRDARTRGLYFLSRVYLLSFMLPSS